MHITVRVSTSRNTLKCQPLSAICRFFQEDTLPAVQVNQAVPNLRALLSVRLKWNIRFQRVDVFRAITYHGQVGLADPVGLEVLGIHPCLAFRAVLRVPVIRPQLLQQQCMTQRSLLEDPEVQWGRVDPGAQVSPRTVARWVPAPLVVPVAVPLVLPFRP